MHMMPCPKAEFYSHARIKAILDLVSRSTMRLPSLLAFASTVILGAVAFASQPLDWVVAVVNEDVVTHQQLERETDDVERNLARIVEVLPERALLRKQVLDLLIDRSIQIQRAREINASVPANVMESAVQSFRDSNNIRTETDFKKMLSDLGVSAEMFRKSFNEDLLIRTVIQREVVPGIIVSEEDIEQFLRKEHQGYYDQRYLISHIQIATSNDMSRDEVSARKALAEEIRRRAQEGEQFEQLALEHSDAASNLQGGDMGWRKGSELPLTFLDGLADLDEGDITAVISTGNGHHILKLRGKEAVIDGQEIGRVQIKQISVDDTPDAEDLLSEVRRQVIEEGQDFDDLARIHSNDQSTADNGEDPAWVSFPDMLPEFQETIYSLEIGGLSAPMRSRFGWHLLKLIDVELKSIDVEEMRRDALQQIRQQRLEVARKRWLNTLKRRAHIDIREDELGI